MDPLQTVAAVALGLVLAATCGLRAFLPLGLISGLGASGLLELPEILTWMGEPLALLCFGIATFAEVLGDKIPAVDHAMDVVGTFVRPAAGAVVGGALMAGADPMVACVFGLAGGTAVAGATHLGKSGVRVSSSLTTGGAANPVVSLAEDAVVIAVGTLAALGAVVATQAA
ncbi:MAG: DUF4126 domain-containing protein [Proteobacteria bacterium]|nr:DUF4126 domain-containing protein [Pseudomonadota bacterium]MCP4916708.1 DUF4126 domain-containing protein [Pseudomonadota bacterium]